MAKTAKLLLLTSLLTWHAGSAPAGQPAPPPQPSPPAAPQPTFRTEANYVRVDVYPTRDGAPVADLSQEEFEVVENGVPQKIEQFEHVVIRAAGAQETRVEPNTVAESRAMAENPRARLFVLFLDTYHVDIAASHNIRRPLVEALDRVIGRDDLVGVMTPEMSARDVTFARRTTTIEGLLTRYWHWGERDRMNPRDQEDQDYAACYPNSNAPRDECRDQNGVAAEMIDRRHEKRSLDALQDLVRFLRGIREERKAILAISNGWLLFRPNPQLMRPLNCSGVPTGPPVGIDPRTGRLTTKPPDDGVPRNTTCQTDRVMLAQIDDEKQFRDILDEANRANASFYPVDPRGLAVFDTPMVRFDTNGAPAPMTPLAVDRAMLTARLTSLRTLAGATDGLAIVDTNDLSGGLRRVVADLSSYYLLGYYSNGKLDGRFHSITVRVKRPGVSVRARRGYLAATPAAVTASTPRTGDTTPAPAAVAETAAIDAALAALGGASRDVPIRLRTASAWKPGSRAAIWVVGEVNAGEEWKGGAEADLMLTSAADATVASTHARIEPGGRSFRIALAPAEPLAAGSYTLRVRARGGSSSAPSNETLNLTLPEPPLGNGALFVRRGPSGNREMPTADVRFRRNEQLRVEIPAPGEEVSARLLDRTGRALAIPVLTAVREDSDGSRWVAGQLALAPLAAGDYIVEFTNGSTRVLAAFRVIN